MASTRKSRNVSKRFSKVNEESPDKDGGTASKGRGRKRKLSDMLGYQWSKEELERFYGAYRKYGKDWKKVAGTIRNRSTDTVEALYNMNKAYLSLPDGVATAAGLIAMMTDHYNILEGSDSDRESNDGIRTAGKPQKRGRGKLCLNSTKGTAGTYPDLLQYQSSPSSFGCLSLLKKKRSGGNQPRVVGKRTPRFPVSYVSEKSDRNKIISPRRQGFNLKSERDAEDDEGAHVAALALAEAFQRGGSPQVSRTPGSKMDALSSERKTDEECPEGSLGSREAENEDFIREDATHPLESESAGTVATKRKARKPKGKRAKVGGENQFDDAREACSGTEEGLTTISIKDEIDTELTDKKGAQSSHGPRKRSRQLFFGDESSAFDALQTLADLSLNMLLPSSTVESESSAQVKEEKRNFDVEKPCLPEKMPKNDPRDKTKHANNKDSGQPPVAGMVVKRKRGKIPKASIIDTNASSEAKQDTDQSISKVQKRKKKASKLSKAEVIADSCLDESKKNEVTIEEGKKTTTKAKRISQVIPPSKQATSIKPPEYSSSSTDLVKAATDGTETAPQVSTFSEVYLPIKHKSRRKMSLQKALARKELKPSEGAGENRPDKYLTTVNDRAMNLKEKLSYTLLSPLLRRWCAFEWFYSAIDYPWFAKSEFVEYLNHVGLGHVPRLTRVEWGVIRSSLGKPRRLSQQFLQEEREKLEQYRESVRTHYTELRAGIREGLPTDLARPLSVGQRVTACHPKTREIHDGSVLTVDRNRCRVQFDRPELGVEFVMDIDCMPLNPLENMPDALRKRSLVERFYEVFNEVKPYDHLKEWKIGSSMMPASGDNMESIDESIHGSTSDHPMNTLIKHAKGDTIDAVIQAKAAANEVAVATRQAIYAQPCTLAQIQAREDDIRALLELTLALDKKAALLTELWHMNEEVSLKQKEGESIRDFENFRKQYAMVLLQLRDANDLVASALLYLRQRNTYLANSTPPRLRSMENPAGPPGTFNESTLPNRDSGSHVVEVVESSRRKARTMVDVAVQAMSSLKEGEDAFRRVGEALDSTKKWHSGADSGAPLTKNFHANESGRVSSTYQDQLTSEPMPAKDALDVKPNNAAKENESHLPSELISSCVSTLFMIQRCTEQQYPPAEVAQILESAVTSLLPCCSQNLPIYRDIEVCMGIIKNQMLALIPTPCTMLPVEHSVV